MDRSSRRGFLTNVGSGMLAAGLGAALASDLGFSTLYAAEGADSIALGEHARLVELMRATPAEKLQPLLAKMLLQGEADLKQLMCAGALANAVTFGGSDYIGYHTAMAMLPALEMSRLSPQGRTALPVLKVLYRNAQQIQKVGGASKTELHALQAAEHDEEHDLGLPIRDACRQVDTARGEQLLATAASPLAAFNALQPAIQDDLNVHRFVFAHRTYGLIDLLGKEYAFSLLRQCVRFCTDAERSRIRHKQEESPVRKLVPQLLDQYKLAGKSPGQRDPGDAEVEKLANTVYTATRESAAEAVAAALADGIDPEVVGEAISLASNLYVLRQGTDKWRTHGDSPGVHSTDATNAWRNMARVAETKHALTGLIVAAYHAGVQSPPFHTPAYPVEEHRKLVKAKDAPGLLAETEDAIRHNDQGRATAALALYGEAGFDVEPVFALLLKYAVSEDGRLHGEKYYHTVREEYRTTRVAFRWRQIIALARVTASSYGYDRDDKNGFRAAGYEEACKLFGVQA